MKPCLLFDSDGTLVDSELLNCEAMSAELALSGAVESAESLVGRYRGGNFLKIMPDLEQRHGVQLPADFNERFRQRAMRHFTQYLQPIAGISDALSQLDYPKCVASNAPMEKLQHVLAITDLGKYFHHLYSAYEVRSWKPDPGLFLHAASDMGFAPDQCIVVEDSDVGVSAALNAGMRVILYDPAQAGASTSAATITIDHMKRLPEAVQQLC